MFLFIELLQRLEDFRTSRKRQRSKPKTEDLAPTKGHGPDAIGYAVREYGQDISSWSRVAVAWAHQDDQGYDIHMEAVPVDGRLVLRGPRKRITRVRRWLIAPLAKTLNKPDTVWGTGWIGLIRAFHFGWPRQGRRGACEPKPARRGFRPCGVAPISDHVYLSTLFSPASRNVFDKE